jgi:putative endonuclease
MQCWVYILHSAKLDKFYVGISEHVKKRLRQHQHGVSTWTSRADDWVEVFRHPCDSIANARAREKAIKARGARRFLAEQLPNPAAEAGQG